MSTTDETDHVSQKKDTTSVNTSKKDDVIENSDKSNQNKGKNWVKFEEDDNDDDKGVQVRYAYECDCMIIGCLTSFH